MRALLVLGLALLASGCSVTRPGFVQEQWRSNMEELGIYAKFPPAEDVKVGDLYLLSAQDLKPASGGAADDTGAQSRRLVFGTLLATLGNTTTIAEHYAKRYGYEVPTLPIGTGTEATTAALTQTAVTVPQQMRRVAFPEFFKLQLDQASLGALIPIGAVATRLGLSAAAFESATVSVEDAGSTALPLGSLLSSLVTGSGTINPAALGFTSTEHARFALQSLAQGYRSAGAASSSTVPVFLINEVFYARSFDISANQSASAGLRALPVGASVATTGTSQGAPTPASGSSLADAASRAASEATRETTVTVAEAAYDLKASRYSENRVGMTKTYRRYVAIGFRGVKLLINSQTLAAGIDVNPPRTQLMTVESANDDRPPRAEVRK